MPNNETIKGAKIPRTDMPCQDPNIRNKNFTEVALGYTHEQALSEASRCLRCKKPLCRDGCPVEVRIPEFIEALAQGDLANSYKILKSTNSLPAVCGRVCPQEKQCEGSCILSKKGEAVAIGRLERYVADFAIQGRCEVENACPTINPNIKVACIGAGPASLTAAGYLASQGIKVSVYEALHEAGGVLIYGIPAFRLPKDIVASEIQGLKDMQVDFHLNYIGGRTVTIDSLFEDGYKAIFIGVGAGLPQFLGIPGENVIGVFSANEYLTRNNLGRAYEFPEYDTPIIRGQNITVYGAGNVAMDAARTAKRLGAKSVRIVYRRSKVEMPARHEEIEHAIEEGVEILELVAPTRFEADEKGWLTKVHLQRMELGEADSSGRRSPKVIANSDFELDTDLAIIALGTNSNPLLLESSPKLELNKRKYIVTDPDTCETSIPNVFAGGDIVSGAATVIMAMGAGRRAAMEIVARLLG